jgi:regulator of replication initiation timing
MTDNFLQKLEEKVMVLLTELETLRKEMTQLRKDNAALKADKANYANKLQGLISLLESLEPNEVAEPYESQVVELHEEYATA